MEFVKYLQEQTVLHPSMLPQDVVKLCYQAAFGVEHLLQDREAAERYFSSEYDRTPVSAQPLWECIHNNVCRVNLGAWKKRGIPSEWLFRMFLETAAESPADGQREFVRCLRAAEELLEQGAFRFDKVCWQKFLAEYPLEKPGAVHHSEVYRNEEQPAYRLVSRRFIRLFPILEALGGRQEVSDVQPAALGGRQEVSDVRPAPLGRRQEVLDVQVVAIDGRCASGKTTLAEMLAEITGAGVVHMDDFFLPMELRTPERLAERGGNVHYERVLQEVIPMLQGGEAFSYERFDCSTGTLGEKRAVAAGRLRIVEGAYSCHPKLGDYMSLRVFSHVEEAEQLRRIEQRDGKDASAAYRERWIPMEEAYLAAFRIEERADLIL